MSMPEQATESEIDRLVQELNSLHGGELVVVRLIAIGTRAIEPLRRFLLEGKPGAINQPRRWAVEILGALGAKEVLIEYLKGRKEIPDPATRFAERALEDAAARTLAAWRTNDVLEVLLNLTAHGPQPGVVEALGKFACRAAVPYFIQALEDDFCRTLAEDALRILGREAETALFCAARTPQPSADRETPSSLLRRTAALELLVEIPASPDLWPGLRPLLAETDPALITAVSKIAAILGNSEDQGLAVQRLLDVLPRAGWYLEGEIEECLMRLYAEGRSRIQHEIAVRSAGPPAEIWADRSLRTLLRVSRRAS